MFILVFITALFCCSHTIFGQSNYQLSQFSIAQEAAIKGTNGNSKGLAIQFLFSPTTKPSETYNFRLLIEHKEQKVASIDQTFSYECSDSILYLIDSMGIDSIPNLDTLYQFYIPYSSIRLEEGMHNIRLVLTDKNQSNKPLYETSYRFKQVKIYDLFFDLGQATVLPDSGKNPLGLGYNTPDPKWLVKVGAYDLIHGLKNRNKFEPIPKKATTSISDYDPIEVCVFNADPTANKAVACYSIQHGQGDFAQTYKDHQLGKQVIEANFSIQKLERKPAESNFKIIEDYSFKNIRGLKIDFTYSLPLDFKRKSLAILLNDHQGNPLEHVIDLNNKRTQETNRIIGDYSYFIPYYNLNKINYIDLALTANKQIIRQHQSESLTIESALSTTNIQQTVGYLHQGISGILYQLDFNIKDLPQGAQLKLSFPSLPDEIRNQLIYWNGEQPSKIYKGSNLELPYIQQQSIFVFLPYYVAPKFIRLHPQLTIEAIDIPTITLATFESKEYACPSSLSDIQINALPSEHTIFTGLAGQHFKFTTNVPDYYHSKGFFEFVITANGQPITADIFVNGSAENSLTCPIHSQKELSVFIPYRFMQQDATYKVSLQAKSEHFMLSEARQIQYINTDQQLKLVGFFLEQFQSKEWSTIQYKVGVRNTKNLNKTYEHLSYKTIIKESVKIPHKPNFPKAIEFEAALDDELVIWIKEVTMRDEEAIKIKTSIAEILNNKNKVEIKNKEQIKQATFKIIPK